MINFDEKQKEILAVLKDFGGVATTNQIAEKTGLKTTEAYQILNASYPYVWQLARRAGETKWRLKPLASRTILSEVEKDTAEV